ncbi:hypothetical protein KFK09_012398 [Dendrobium nobile]|uniref:Uncharacterized protein n=1 Tax=Dendrobium nobile TaxID=94219 RepID=A0A8T3BFE4_DENNO|nr:hypothetical protein KFK09_012398 [Dendrobium nobile]
MCRVGRSSDKVRAEEQECEACKDYVDITLHSHALSVFFSDPLPLLLSLRCLALEFSFDIQRSLDREALGRRIQFPSTDHVW